MKSAIWISYDLGVNGDYEGMYAWLDDQEAVECGSSVAYIAQYTYDGEDLAQALRGDIRDAVEVDKRTRIYVIGKFAKGKRAGKFLFGGRKGSPWDGYGEQGEISDDEM